MSQQLEEAQADQKRKQLQLREEALTKREALLDDTERLAKVELLDKQIAFKEEQLEGLNKAFVKREAEAAEATDYLLERIAELERTKDKAQKDINGQVSKQEKLDEQYKATQKDLILIKGEIAARKKYFDAQEVVITETIADWNGQLTGFQQEANAIADQKKTYLAEFTRLEQSKQTISDEEEVLRDKFKDLEDIYAEKAIAYKVDLKAMREELADARQETEDISRQNQAKHKAAETREQSLNIREAAANQKERDLSDREQRLQMRLGMVQ